MCTPQNLSDLRRFMGLVNQLGKFSSKIADISQPLRELMSTKRVWVWGPAQDKAFMDVKEELSKPSVLALYDPNAETKVSADASSFGLGAVLLQSKNSTWKPVAYASRSLSDAEKRYAQIEKEALATTWGCEKFSTYLIGKSFQIETDHKPLVPLLNTKHLDDLPPRILRFRLRLAKYSYIAKHIPGKLLYAADALSRSPVGTQEDKELQDEVQAYVNHITMPSLPASIQVLEKYRKAQMEDTECRQAREFCQSQWPRKGSFSGQLKPYWKVRSSLTVCEDLLLYNGRIVVPSSLRKEVLLKVHSGHQGAEKCRLRVKQSVWWPGVASQVQQFVENCQECAREARPRKEPLLPTPLPDYPWQVVAADLFELQGTQYLLVVDYFSRFPEICKLRSTTSGSVIAILKAIFARHGIPEVFRSDNGPQFASGEFTEFSKTYGFEHLTSSN